MCGIIGAVCNTDENCISILFKGLKYMQNRGYDSAGFCTSPTSEDLICHKYASTESESALELLEKHVDEHKPSLLGFGHTRWATHGPKTDINSHPHISFKGKFTIVHNGIIENYAALKKMLMNDGKYSFYSDTDTEVICNLLEYYYLKYSESDTNKQNDREYVSNIIQKAQDKMNGSWGLVIHCNDTPDTLYCVRHGSPLLVGRNNNEVIVASEQAGFGNRVNTYFCLNTNDVCTIYKKGGSSEIFVNTSFTYKLKNTRSQLIRDTPDPYPHWTIREIHEQPDTIRNAISMGGRVLSNNQVRLGGLHDHKDTIMSCENIILLGCGTSYHSGFLARSVIKDMCDMNCVLLFDGAEFNAKDIPSKGKTCAIFISQSGETKDLHRCISIAKSNDVFTIGVVNVVDSLIAREVDCGVYLNAGTEVAVASTKSFTSQTLVLTMISIWIAQNKNKYLSKRTLCVKDINNLSEQVSQTISISENIIDDELLSVFDSRNSCFLLGKSSGEGCALEGSLKIKEITYIHAEGYSSSALKHGPFALLDEGFPVLLFCPSDDHYSKNVNAFQEVVSRGASVLVVCNSSGGGVTKTLQEEVMDTTETFKSAKKIINVPENPTFQSLINMVFIQILAYKLAVKKGINPDTPKNLAKVVTVE
tara:strand:+ start:2454 stop:4394 length:1941 start_codon:yes stop_codon:yes gene_type:complete